MEMHAIHIVALLITGIAVGFASGLLGIGGCFIMIPVQYWVYVAIGVDPGVAIKCAFGTNLFVVLPTAMSGALGHHGKGAVWWRAAIYLGGCGLIGAVIGATIATHVPGKVLKIVFGAVIVAGGIRMLTAKPPSIEEEPKDSPLLWVLWGFPMGIVTGFIGIGGGVLMVPTMTLFLRFKIHRAVGTSTGMMILTSIGGLIGYIANGWGIQGIPPPNLGYVHIWSWLALAVTSIAVAQVGARVAHLLPARQLKLIFIIVMFYMGLKMIGVFNWLHLPI
jgi:uncharacterized membrane protein YfcA